MRPSTNVDGDRPPASSTTRIRPRKASMRPSTNVDGDSPGGQGGSRGQRASMRPSTNVDGDAGAVSGNDLRHLGTWIRAGSMLLIGFERLPAASLEMTQRFEEL